MAKTIEEFQESMRAKVALAKTQVSEFRGIVRDATLEEAALYVEETAGAIQGAVLAAGLREMQGRI